MTHKGHQAFAVLKAFVSDDQETSYFVLFGMKMKMGPQHYYVPNEPECLCYATGVDYFIVSCCNTCASSTSPARDASKVVNFA